jgi:dolichyl-phosphate beta-glucosyltransferase
MTKNIYLSVVVPLYNEESIVESKLQKILIYLSRKKFTWEIVFVNDGSSDRTLTIISKLARQKKNNILVVSLPVNKGKGAAVREGVKKASGDFIFFTDIDLSTPIAKLGKFLKSYETGNKVVIGSRRMKESKILDHQPIARELLGRCFTLFTRILLGVPVSDFTCGFKGFDKSVAKKVFAKGIINRWSFDSEILFLANKYGYKITEIPVSWRNRRASRVNLAKDVYRSFKENIQIYFRNQRGLYDG